MLAFLDSILPPTTESVKTVFQCQQYQIDMLGKMVLAVTLIGVSAGIGAVVALFQNDRLAKRVRHLEKRLTTATSSPTAERAESAPLR